MLTTRQINQACKRAARQGQGYVFAETEAHEKLRIIRAKTINGTRKVKTINGIWIEPLKIWVE